MAGTPNLTEREIIVQKMPKDVAFLIGGMNCFSYSGRMDFLHEAEAKFTVDYLNNACCDFVSGTDAYYMHNLLLLVTESGDPPEITLFKIGPFFQPYWDGFDPMKEDGNDNPFSLKIIHRGVSNESLTTKVTFSMESANFETTD